jgi:hypothetical protein
VTEIDSWGWFVYRGDNDGLRAWVETNSEMDDAEAQSYWYTDLAEFYDVIVPSWQHHRLPVKPSNTKAVVETVLFADGTTGTRTVELAFPDDPSFHLPPHHCMDATWWYDDIGTRTVLAEPADGKPEAVSPAAWYAARAAW